MKITEIRDTIQTLNWVLRDSTGGTREENIRTNLPAMLAPHIAKVLALAIPPRFTRDIESRVDALDAADTVIERWNAEPSGGRPQGASSANSGTECAQGRPLR